MYRFVRFYKVVENSSLGNFEFSKNSSHIFSSGLVPSLLRVKLRHRGEIVKKIRVRILGDRRADDRISAVCRDFRGVVILEKSQRKIIILSHFMTKGADRIVWKPR